MIIQPISASNDQRPVIEIMFAHRTTLTSWMATSR